MAPRQKDLEEAEKQENRLTEGGLQWERSCTDSICCIIYTIFLVTVVGLAVYGMQEGEPRRILPPFDSVGNQGGMPSQAGYDPQPNSNNITDVSEFKYK